MTKSYLEKRGVFHLITLRSHTITEESQNRNSKQGPGGRNCSKGLIISLLNGLLPVACPVCFLIPLRTICPGKTTPIVSWTVYHKSLIKKMQNALLKMVLYWLAEIIASKSQSCGNKQINRNRLI